MSGSKLEKTFDSETIFTETNTKLWILYERGNPNDATRIHTHGDY